MLGSLRNPLLRTLVAALAVLALLGATACGGGGEEAQQPQEPAPEETTATEETTAPEETTAGGMEEQYATGYAYQYGEYGPDGVGCELTRATMDMTPEEARAYADEVFAEAAETGDPTRQILNDRGFTCEEGGQ